MREQAHNRIPIHAAAARSIGGTSTALSYNRPVLYERAKQLKGNGLSGPEIRQTLLAEGAREEDIKVILGSLGLGPQPQSDPTPQPLAAARRFLESRPARVAVFVLGAGLLAGFLYVLWIVGNVVWAIAEGFSRGR